ncbi:MAG: hypothetical protein WDW36_007668 [Sanguina aurantia]
MSQAQNKFKGLSTLRAKEKLQAAPKPQNAALQAYLQKYSGGPDASANGATAPPAKKKRKKNGAAVRQPDGLKILDADVSGFAAVRTSQYGGEDDDDDDDNSGDEGPVVVNAEEVEGWRREDERAREYYDVKEDGRGWVQSDAPTAPHRPSTSYPRRPAGRHDSPDESPPRRGAPATARHDSPDDSSPPRRGAGAAAAVRHDPPDASPPRRGPTGSKRHDSPDDSSPPRRGQPPSRARHDSPDASPPRRNTTTASARQEPPDSSPPRRSSVVSNQPPVAQHQQQRQRHDTRDSSPPRRQTGGGTARHDSPDDSSPTRRRNPAAATARHDSPDASPPRRQRSAAAAARHDPAGDSSPPQRRQAANARHDSPDDSSPPRRQGGAAAAATAAAGAAAGAGSGQAKPRMTDGGATGLVNSAQLIAETQRMRAEAEERRRGAGGRGTQIASTATPPPTRRNLDCLFQPPPPLLTPEKRFTLNLCHDGAGGVRGGRGTQTTYRDKGSGQAVSQDDYAAGRADAKRAARADKNPYDEDQTLAWRGGLAQRQAFVERQREMAELAAKPFAHSQLDTRVDDSLREQLRWGDPMAHLVRNKEKADARAAAPITDRYDGHTLSQSGFKVPQEVPAHSWQRRGVGAPLNRYSIKPGRHWDGVDRSSGFEEERFLHLNTRAANNAEARAWSQADM